MDDKILQLCDSFWQFQLQESPELSTYTGYHTGNDKLDVFTVAAYEERKEYCKENLLKSAVSLRKDERYPSTSFENKINLQLLQQYLETFIQGMKFKSYLTPASYTNGIEIWFSKYLVLRVPVVCEQHYRDYACRCKAYKKQLEDVIELMKTGIEQKIMPHSCGMDLVISRIDSVLTSDIEDTPYYKPYLNMPESISKDKQSKIQMEGKDVIKEFIFKPLEMFKTFMCQVYIPSCRKELSVCSLPDGIARYEAMLKFHCDVDLTPEQMHRIGHEQVNVLKARVEKVMKKVDFTGTLQEFFLHVQQDKSFYFDTQEEVVQYMYDLLENDIRPKLGQLFKPAPKYDLIIADVVLGAQPVLAEYIGPTSKKPGILHFPRTSVKRLTKYEVPCLLLHETEPGHHFQASYMVGQEDLPRFRRHKDDRRYFEVPGRFPMNTAYTEGWGLYCEELGEELGIYRDPYSEFGYLSMKLARAVRVVVDTGIHAFGWTLEQAHAYMAENSNLHYERRQKEIDRYVTWPGQACAYTIGHMKIDEIRRKATEQLGSAFDIKEFHEVCLKCGQVPLQILEKIVDNYVEETLKIPGQII